MELSQCELKLADYKSLIGTTLIAKSKSHSILIKFVHCVENFETNDKGFHVRFIYTIDGAIGMHTDSLDGVLSRYTL